MAERVVMRLFWVDQLTLRTEVKSCILGLGIIAAKRLSRISKLVRLFRSLKLGSWAG